MIFTRLTAQHLKSSTGFEIIPAGRFALKYKEGGRVMEVPLEFGQNDNGDACVTVWPGAFARWDEETPVISKEGQARIEKNFRAAMDFDNLDYLVWDPRTEEYLGSAVYHGRLTAN